MTVWFVGLYLRRPVFEYGPGTIACLFLAGHCFGGASAVFRAGTAPSTESVRTILDTVWSSVRHFICPIDRVAGTSSAPCAARRFFTMLMLFTRRCIPLWMCLLRGDRVPSLCVNGVFRLSFVGVPTTSPVSSNVPEVVILCLKHHCLFSQRDVVFGHVTDDFRVGATGVSPTATF